MDCRKNEPPKTWFRSDRVFRSDGHWFFHTREGIAVGPYKTRFEAEIDAGMLKSQLMDIDSADPARARAVIREFLLYADTVPTAPAARADMSDSAFTDYLVEEATESLNPGTA